MEKEEAQACIDKSSRAVDEDSRVKIMVEECIHPPWKKYNVFKEPIKYLKNEIKKLETGITLTEKDLYIRKKKQYDEENGKLILKFFRKRLDLIRSIKIEIEKLKHVSADLKKLNNEKKSEL